MKFRILYILGFGQDADGEIYVLTSLRGDPFGAAGRVHKIVAISDEFVTFG